MIEVNEFQNKCVVFVSSTEKFIPPQSSDSAGSFLNLAIALVSVMSSSLSSISTAAKRSVGQYYVGSRVGSGGFGDVYLGKHKVTNDKLALKFMPVSTFHRLFVVRYLHLKSIFLECWDDVDASQSA